MAQEHFRSYAKVSCLCGAQIRVDTSSTDRHVTCPSCENTFDFVVSMDAARKRSQVSIVLSRAAMKTEGESLGKSGPEPVEPRPQPAPPPSAPSREAAAEAKPKAAPKVSKVSRKGSGKTVKAIMANCECGASFPLEETEDLTSMQSCPQCNCLYHVVFKIEHGTHEKTAMLVPEKPKLPKSRTIAPKPAPPLFPAGAPGNPDDLRVTDFFTPAKKGRTRVGNSKLRGKPKPPAEIPPGAQGVPCSCGTMFIVRRRDLAEGLTCEGCGKAATFEEARDPQTLAPVLRIRKS